MPYKDEAKRSAYDKGRDRSAYEKARYLKRKEYVKAHAKASYARIKARLTPEQLAERVRNFPCRSPAARRKEHIKGRYGLTIEQWQAMFDAQGRKCAICRRTDSGWKRGWHTDHDHETGRLRGILCHLCNRTLGNYGPSRFQAFIDYLTRPPLAPHPKDSPVSRPLPRRSVPLADCRNNDTKCSGRG
jgi:hypothetical protein